MLAPPSRWALEADPVLGLRSRWVQPVNFEAAVTAAELVIMALPDEVHGSVWSDLEVHVPHGCSVGFIHGFSIHHKRLMPRADLGVILVAPKGPGPTLRNRFVKGQGIPALVGVHQTGDADAELHLRRWGTGIGCTRAALIPSSFAEECETDLFGEQAILCGGILALMRASFETLQDAGYSDEVAYIECIHELAGWWICCTPRPCCHAQSHQQHGGIRCVRGCGRLDSKSFEANSKVSSKTSKVAAPPNALPKMPKLDTLGSTAKRSTHDNHAIEAASEGSPDHALAENDA